MDEIGDNGGDSLRRTCGPPSTLWMNYTSVSTRCGGRLGRQTQDGKHFPIIRSADNPSTEPSSQVRRPKTNELSEPSRACRISSDPEPRALTRDQVRAVQGVGFAQFNDCTAGVHFRHRSLRHGPQTVARTDRDHRLSRRFRNSSGCLCTQTRKEQNDAREQKAERRNEYVPNLRTWPNRINSSSRSVVPHPLLTRGARRSWQTRVGRGRGRVERPVLVPPRRELTCERLVRRCGDCLVCAPGWNCDCHLDLRSIRRTRVRFERVY